MQFYLTCLVSLLVEDSSVPTDSTDNEALLSDGDPRRRLRPLLSSTDHNPGYDSEDEEPIHRDPPKPRLTTCQILVINIPWFGLALMYLILAVEGECSFIYEIWIFDYILL